MMTHTEAIDRAKRIWPGTKHDIDYDGARGATVIVDNVWHALDRYGHASCHSKCEDLEAQAEERRQKAHRATVDQLLHEAVSLLDPDDPEHERLDVRDWLRSARSALLPP